MHNSPLGVLSRPGDRRTLLLLPHVRVMPSFVSVTQQGKNKSFDESNALVSKHYDVGGAKSATFGRYTDDIDRANEQWRNGYEPPPKNRWFDTDGELRCLKPAAVTQQQKSRLRSDIQLCCHRLHSTCFDIRGNGWHRTVTTRESGIRAGPLPAQATLTTTPPIGSYFVGATRG